MSFTIYKSEAGVRMENAQLKRDLDAARADNARLRKLCGEPEVEIKAPVQLAAPGQQFESGNCSVVIGAPPNAQTQVNPNAAAVSGRGMARRPNGVPATPVRARPQQAQGVPAAAAGVLQFQMPDEEQAQGDDAQQRFSMLELDLAEAGVGRR